MHHCETNVGKKFWEGGGTTPCVDHPSALAAFVYTLSYTLFSSFRRMLRRPAHRARETVHLLIHETPDFITPALWPANSPDLNPVDYQIWWKLQDRVYRSQIRDVDQLKSRLIEEWEHFHQVVIDKAVRQWRPRIGACVRLRAHGGYMSGSNEPLRRYGHSKLPAANLDLM